MARPTTVSARVSENEALKVEIAAGIKGRSRSAFVREAAVKAAERELNRLQEHPRKDRADE